MYPCLLRYMRLASQHPPQVGQRVSSASMVGRAGRDDAPLLRAVVLEQQLKVSVPRVHPPGGDAVAD